MMFYVPFYNLLEVWLNTIFFYSTKIIYKIIFYIDITYWNNINIVWLNNWYPTIEHLGCFNIFTINNCLR